MLDAASAHTMIAVRDIDRAKRFYSDKLGLNVVDEPGAGATRYEAQHGTWFMLYESQFAGTAKSTIMRFEVEDIEGARVLALLGDSVTTDHISPAGAIKKDKGGHVTVTIVP